MRSLGWQVKQYNNSQLFIKKLPLLPFYVGKMLRGKDILTQKEIRHIKKKYRLLTFSYEPLLIENNDHTKIYFQVPKNSMQLTPTKTLWIDLTKSQTELMANLKPKTRYNLKQATKKLDYEIISDNNIDNNTLTDILNLWSANKPYSKLFPAPKKEFISLLNSFGKNCFIVRSFAQDSPNNTIALCLILCSPNMAFYWHNASSDVGKKLFAPTICLWQALMESKKRGLKVFDFEGLYDKRFPKKNLSWKGFSRFKEGFSGNIVL